MSQPLAATRRGAVLACRVFVNLPISLALFWARTILCPPINLFLCSYTYDGIIDFSITTTEQLCPDPETLAAGLQTELDRLLTLARPASPRRRRRPNAAAAR